MNNSRIGRKPCQKLRGFYTGKYAMPPAFLTCPSCGKMNAEGGRYCIQCGSILSPIYCSSCGTKNPDGLEQCLECGSSLPSLAGLRWNPIVTVLSPTSAMSGEELPTVTADAADKTGGKWLRRKADRRERTGKANARQTSASNHT